MSGQITTFEAVMLMLWFVGFVAVMAVVAVAVESWGDRRNERNRIRLDEGE